MKRAICRRLFIILSLLVFMRISSACFSVDNVVSPESQQKSSATAEAISRFSRLDYEIGAYGRTVSEGLLRCSYMQDAWLAYLGKAETPEEFLQGMTLLERLSSHFHIQCSYAGSVVNFFAPGKPRFLLPQIVQEASSHDTKAQGFLNTFKTGRALDSTEREQLFAIEYNQYLSEGIVQPFKLDLESLSSLESGALYNFVLLPSGDIRLALEKPGGRNYTAEATPCRGELAYPNHTILANSPHQSVLTAGAIVVHRTNGKQLIFVSPKSGHFVPHYYSLNNMKNRLIELGIPPQTIILVPTINLAEAILSSYYWVQIPISLENIDVHNLFSIAHSRWTSALKSLDMEFLRKLVQGEYDPTEKLAVHELNLLREEATYMRHAYQLFSNTHQSPKAFHRFVKKFGKLKDALKHNLADQIRKRATQVCVLLEQGEVFAPINATELASPESIYAYIQNEILYLKHLLTQEVLPSEAFHDLKKGCRELATLFLHLAEATKWEGRYHSIYLAAATIAQQMNLAMAAMHDPVVGQFMRGETSKDAIFLKVPDSVAIKLDRLLDQLKVPVEKICFKISFEVVADMINQAKQWYAIHFQLSAADTSQDESFIPPVQRLLQKIVRKEAIVLEGDNLQALDDLKWLCRYTEIACHALRFLDSTHQVPKEICSYLNTLQRIVYGIERGDFRLIIPDAASMLEYLQNHFALSSLEDWVYTDQESLDALLTEDLHAIGQLYKDSISKEEAFRILEKIQGILDLLDLYLQLGQEKHNLPTIAFEMVFYRGQQLLNSLQKQLSVAGEAIAIPEAIQLDARRFASCF
jgi:hypothetical protein